MKDRSHGPDRDADRASGFPGPRTRRPIAEPARTDASATTSAAAPCLMQPPTIAEEPETPDMIDATTAAPARRPTKFMADLSRAMQTAAETSRDETMARFIADSKAAVEEIQAASHGRGRRPPPSRGRRRRRDPRMVQGRDRPHPRRDRGAHRRPQDAPSTARWTRTAPVVETRVQRVGATVEAFQAEMDAFFERLLRRAGPDPHRDDGRDDARPARPGRRRRLDRRAGRRAVRRAAGPSRRDAGRGRHPTRPPRHGRAGRRRRDPSRTPTRRPRPRRRWPPASTSPPPRPRPSPSPATSTTAARRRPNRQRTPAEIVRSRRRRRRDLANADAGTLPPAAEASASTTRVVVVGLVSVASIATFKRGLSRVGRRVSAVGVASGPDGEFVFTVEHDDEPRPGRRGHGASRVRGTGHRRVRRNGLEVTAHDPDTGD